MPPKGANKAKSKEQVADPGGAEAGVEVNAGLVTGEQGAQNLGFHTEVQVAWSEVTARFTGLESEDPLSIAARGFTKALLPDGPRGGFEGYPGHARVRHQLRMGEPIVLGCARGPRAHARSDAGARQRVPRAVRD